MEFPGGFLIKMLFRDLLNGKVTDCGEKTTGFCKTPLNHSAATKVYSNLCEAGGFQGPSSLLFVDFLAGCLQLYLKQPQVATAGGSGLAK